MPELELPATRRGSLRRAAVVDYLGARCAYCGYTEDLELDHKDPFTRKTRDQDVARMTKTQIIAELPLLQVLCRDCHAAKSRYDRAAKAGQRAFWEHGTITGYFHSGCRCDLCRDAMREYYRQKKAGAVR